MTTIVAVVVVIALVAVLLLPRIRRFEYRYRDVLLFAIAFTMPLRGSTVLSFAGGNVRLGDVLLLIAVAVVALEFAVVRPSVRLTEIDLLLVMFVLWCFCTIAWSLDRGFGVTRSVKYFRDLLLFAVVASWSRGRFVEAFRAVSAGVVGSFAYILPLAAMRIDGDRLLQLIGGRDPAIGLTEFRGPGGIGSMTFGSEATILAVAFWTNVAIFFLLGRGGWLARSPAKRVGFWVLMFGLLVLEIVTFSRGAWLGLAVGGACWLVWIGPGIRGRLIAGAATLLVVALLLAYKVELHQLMLHRVASFTEGEADQATFERFELWRRTVAVLEKRPMGVGIGGTTVAVEKDAGLWLVHNLYLQLLAELGPIGFGLAIGGLSLAMVRGILTARATEDRGTRVAAASIAAGIVFYLVMGLVFFDFADLEIWLLLAMATALPLAACPVRSAEVAAIA